MPACAPLDIRIATGMPILNGFDGFFAGHEVPNRVV